MLTCSYKSMDHAHDSVEANHYVDQRTPDQERAEQPVLCFDQQKTGEAKKKRPGIPKFDSGMILMMGH